MVSVAVQVIVAITPKEDRQILLASQTQIGDLVLFFVSLNALNFEMNFWFSFAVELIAMTLCRIVNITTVDRDEAVRVIHLEIITYATFLFMRTMISRRIFTTTLQKAVLKVEHGKLLLAADER